MKKKIYIIGSGFSSLAASCYLAKAGYEVSVLEKNSHLGGRAQQLQRDGFTFDMGPSFYWMPDVFESFFSDFGKKPSDYYALEKLNPAYRVVFSNKSVTIPDNITAICEVFESLEKGSGIRLQKYIQSAGNNYKLAIQNLVYQPGEHLFEIISKDTIRKLPLFFTNIAQDSKKIASSKQLQQILQFPVLFLGAKPSATPSFYNFMNYADFALGTWHPQGGMYQVVEAMVSLAKELGVHFYTNKEVQKLEVSSTGSVTEIHTNGQIYFPDIVLSGADYVHTENLITKSKRQYSAKYWKKKVFAPSALLFYIGFDRELPNISHHTLFFDTDFEVHAKAIYDKPSWPKSPLFYGSFPSKTDASVAPKGKEAGVILIPLATHLEETEEVREFYFHEVIKRVSKTVGFDVMPHVLFKEYFGIQDFVSQYNSYGGNAYGLANTLLQTHVLRPKLRSKKVNNLFFTGQLTVPGPGVPPALISGKIVSTLIQNHFKKTIINSPKAAVL